MIKILSIHSHRPDFVKMQAITFQRWLKPEFDLTIINNARDAETRDLISQAAEDYGLNVVHFESDIPFSLCGKHHAMALNYAWQNWRSLYDFTMVMDGDVFLLDDFDVREYMGSAPLAGAYQQRHNALTRQRYHYLGPILAIASHTLPDTERMDWEGCEVDGIVNLDTGGKLYYYFRRFPETVKAKTLSMLQTWDINYENQNVIVLPEKMIEQYDERFGVQMFQEVFLHYTRSSNWDWKEESFHRAKTSWVKHFISERLEGRAHLKRLGFMINKPEYFGWT